MAVPLLQLFVARVLHGPASAPYDMKMRIQHSSRADICRLSVVKVWCLGEITTARHFKVPTIVIGLPGYKLPDDEFISTRITGRGAKPGRKESRSSLGREA
eukprot:6458825-Amphidinium_carterae.2